eukprot:157767-Pyramimonas_sp.AAC.1
MRAPPASGSSRMSEVAAPFAEAPGPAFPPLPRCAILSAAQMSTLGSDSVSELGSISSALTPPPCRALGASGASWNSA